MLIFTFYKFKSLSFSEIKSISLLRTLFKNNTIEKHTRRYNVSKHILNITLMITAQCK